MKKILTDTVKKKFKPIYTEGKAQLKKKKKQRTTNQKNLFPGRCGRCGEVTWEQGMRSLPRWEVALGRWTQVMVAGSWSPTLQRMVKNMLVPATVSWGNFLPDPKGNDLLYTKHESRSGTIASLGPPRGGQCMWSSQWPPDALDQLNHYQEVDWENQVQVRQFLTIHHPWYTQQLSL